VSVTSENVEEYIEAIWQITRKKPQAKTCEIAEQMRVAPASVTEMLQRLDSDGFVVYEKYKGAALTPKGEAIGAKMKRRHRLLERFLVDIIGLGVSQSHDEACRLEHTLSDESERKICQMLNNPSTCPDGEPIPSCGEDCQSCAGSPSVPLDRLAPGTKCSISHLICQDPDRIRRVIAMGLVPGRSLCVESFLPMDGPLIIQIDDSKIALAREYARLVHVIPGGECGHERPRRRRRRPEAA
jgi:DtxR family Mn-dependent transcriptional regulator